MGTGVKNWCLNPPYGKEILSSCNYLGFHLGSPKFHIVFIVTSVCQGIMHQYFIELNCLLKISTCNVHQCPSN